MSKIVSNKIGDRIVLLVILDWVKNKIKLVNINRKS